MTHLFRKSDRIGKIRRRKRPRRRKTTLQPLTPEAYAALLAARDADRQRQNALRKQWATEDAMYRTAAVLEGKRRAALRTASPQPCARELTRPPRDNA